MKKMLLLASLLAGVLSADQISLKNGDRVTGKILTSDDKTITLKTEMMGEVKIDRSAIVSIRSEEALNVTMKDGKKVQGKIDTVEEKLRVETADRQTVTSPLVDVGAIRSDAAQKAWEREQERIANPRFNDFWSGFLAFGLANASGNASTRTVNTNGAMSRATGKDKQSLYFNQLYATQSTTLPFGATANRIGGGYRYDRNVSNKLFVFGTTDFDYDQFLRLDLRSVLGGGLGYKVFQNNKGFLNVSSGGAYTREKFNTGLTRNFAELLIGEELGYNPNPRLKLSQRFTIYPNLQDTGEFRYLFDAGAAVPIYKFLEWTVGVNNRYLSAPPLPTLKNNDFLFTTGVRFSFDQTKR